jgi:hypothetical protein
LPRLRQQAESPGESEDRTRLSATMRCTGIDDSAIRECAVKYWSIVTKEKKGAYYIITTDGEGGSKSWRGLLIDQIENM